VTIIFLPTVERRCDLCDHAAMSSRGVFCTLLGEDIWDEKIAEECELFEPGDNGVHPIHKEIRLDAIVDNSERERTLTISVVLPYYGRADQGPKLLEGVIRHLELTFGKDVQVRDAS
jgi:hypothetical protein